MIPITKPYFTNKEIETVSQTLLSGWVTQGPKVAEFETRFASYVGARFACAVSSCTTALHLSLLALGVKPGETVITVSHSFIATANSVRYCLSEPVFIDIDPQTFNINVSLLEKCLLQDCFTKNGQLFYKKMNSLITNQSPISILKKVTGRVGAILIVHQMGFPANLQPILTLAKKFRIPVIEDAACAIGSEISLNGGESFDKIGKPHGDIACFSFHPRKLLTTGDGGMMTTNNKNYYKKLKLLRQHYMDIPDTKRHDSKKVIFEQYNKLGYNYRLTDIQAAIGIEQLKKVDKIVKKRRELANYYKKNLENIPWIITTSISKNIKPNWQSYPIRIRGDYGINQKKLMQYLLEKGISSRRGIMNAHQEKPYRNLKWNLPHSEMARNITVLLPLYQELSYKDIKFIVNTISLFRKNG